MSVARDMMDQLAKINLREEMDYEKRAIEDKIKRAKAHIEQANALMREVGSDSERVAQKVQSDVDASAVKDEVNNTTSGLYDIGEGLGRLAAVVAIFLGSVFAGSKIK